jgi:hypothetical protein
MHLCTKVRRWWRREVAILPVIWRAVSYHPLDLDVGVSMDRAGVWGNNAPPLRAKWRWVWCAHGEGMCCLRTIALRGLVPGAVFCAGVCTSHPPTSLCPVPAFAPYIGQLAIGGGDVALRARDGGQCARLARLTWVICAPGYAA